MYIKYLYYLFILIYQTFTNLCFKLSLILYNRYKTFLELPCFNIVCIPYVIWDL